MVTTAAIHGPVTGSERWRDTLDTVLITGGAGFFGRLLKARLLAAGAYCVSVDLEPDDDRHPNLLSHRADIRDRPFMDRLFAAHRFTFVYHCAAILAHAAADTSHLWTSNVDGTRIVAEMARRFAVRHLTFLSSNCLWGRPLGRPVLEDDDPSPVEIYGRSKWEGEKILRHELGDVSCAIIRCPTIIDEGRLGLLAILFSFIAEGRKVWVVGGGRNRYQFIYAQDLVEACLRAAECCADGIFNIGSEDVGTFRDVYQYVIDRAGTGARVASLPLQPTLLLMRLAHKLRLSPLGPYQYRMIGEDFVFDTTRIRSVLGWRATLTNEEMLWKAYKFYQDHQDQLAPRAGLSAHRQPARMGIIRLLKAIS